MAYFTLVFIVFLLHVRCYIFRHIHCRLLAGGTVTSLEGKTLNIHGIGRAMHKFMYYNEAEKDFKVF